MQPIGRLRQIIISLNLVNKGYIMYTYTENTKDNMKYYTEGFEALLDGCSEADNPYEHGTMENSKWFDGWYDSWIVNT